MKCCSAATDARGVVTPFVSIVAALITFLNFAMHDHVTAAYQVNYTERLNRLAAGSILAQFDKRLSSNYGLFCIDAAKETELVNRYYAIMDEERYSLTDYLLSGEGLDMMRFKKREVTGIRIEFSGSITDPEVLEREISDLMKYKSWGNAAVKVVSAAGELCGYSAEAGAASYLRRVDGILDGINEKKKELETGLEGTAGIPGTGVNGFFSTPFAADRAGVMESVAECIPDGYMISDKTAVNRILDALTFYCSCAAVYGEKNKSALAAAEEIIGMKREAEELLAAAEAAAGSAAGSEEGSVSGDGAGATGISGASAGNSEEIRKMIYERKKRLSEVGDYSFTAEMLSGNYFRMQDCLAGLDRLKENASRTGNVKTDDIDSLLALADEAYGKYVRVEQKIKAVETIGGEEFDLYEHAVDAAAVILDFLPAGNVTIPEDIYEGLPSRGSDGDGGEMVDRFISFTHALDPLIAGKICTALKTLAENGGGILNEYYVDDYICTYLNDTSGPKDINNHYLNGETEYVFAGSGSDDENMIAAYSGIYAVRFIMNIVHLLTDEEKREVLEGISEAHPAAAIAAAASWASLESALDVAELRDGKKIPLVKRAADWKISSYYGEAAAAERDEDDRETNLSAMSYSDYLRLLLLLVPKETKIMRILDVLELNYYKDNRVYKSFDDFYTGVTVICGLKLDTIVRVDALGRKRFDWSVEYGDSY